MELILDNSYTDIVFTPEEEQWLKPIVEEEMHYKLGVKEEGYIFSPAYKSGHWDGIRDFYEKKEQRFPTGLMGKVEEILGELQNTHRFTYSVFDNRPDVFIDPGDLPEEIKLLDNEIGEITLRDYQYGAFESVFSRRMSVIHMGTGGGKTEVASGIIKQTLPEMESKETIAFFTMSKEIFNQTADRLEERLGMPIGRYGAGKKDIKKVNVVMVPTIAAALKIDPEKGVKLTAKERIVKKMAKDIAPKYLKGVNQKQLLRAFIQNFEVKTKADENFLAEIDELIYTSESDAKIKFKLNAYKVKYEEIIEKKNKKKLKKKKDVQDFLDSIVMFISDEHQHISADSLYNTLLACNNAIYRIGLSGSIDDKDKMLLQRMESVTGLPSARVTSSYLIGEGHLAKPTIIMTPIYGVEQGRETVNISGLKDYMAVYEHGIVKNEYRNKLIAKITEMCYHKDEGVLIIVNRIEHGETVSRLLDLLNVPHEFLQGEVEDDIRQEKLQAMREGHLKVMIATSIMDEGVDISGIDTLIMAAGGKSLRQTIQRVGRAIRKKKGKENTASVYDFEDRTHDYLFRHAKERRKIYEAEEFDVNYIE